MVTFWIDQFHIAVIVCTFDWSSTGIKQFLHFIHQNSEKRIDIRFQFTVLFKYISKGNLMENIHVTPVSVPQARMTILAFLNYVLYDNRVLAITFDIL